MSWRGHKGRIKTRLGAHGPEALGELKFIGPAAAFINRRSTPLRVNWRRGPRRAAARGED